MSVAGNQARNYLRLVQQLAPRWRIDQGLPRAIQSLLAAERRFGSRDRRLYRELIYTTLRYLPWIEPWLARDPDEAVRRVAWLAGDVPAARAFVGEFARGEVPTGDLAELLPSWFREHCPEVFSPLEIEAQLRRAPLWLRLQNDAASGVAASLAGEGYACTPSPVLPSAWRAPDDAAIDRTEAYQNGWIEIQDLGSQLLLESIGLSAGERWLDACAGAGGKTLQLARLLGASGSVTAHDIRPAALEELRARANRAGLRNVTTTSTPRGEFDGVLVDAPCSGSGTWRRSPHLKWTTTPGVVADRARLQRELLGRFAAHVRPGGRLIYATCSLSSRENEDVVAAFLAERPEFRPEAFARTFDALPRGAAGLLLLPARHDTDGFFVASLRRG